MKIIHDIVDFLYPRVCVVSETNLPEDNSNNFISDSTLTNLIRPTKLQLNELRAKVKSDFAFALFDFPHKSDFEKIVHHLKYSGMKDLGVFLGEHLAGYAKLEIEEQKINYDFVIPVPLHRTKLRERGYNQSDYIAKGLSGKLHIPELCDAVIRKRYTKSQTKLNRSQREKNMQDAFSLSESYNDKLKDRNVIIIDDVITTGATVNECIKVLKSAGVNKIFTLSLAMAE